MFSTDPVPAKSKTKCMIFSDNQNELVNVAPITLTGTALPWVEQLNHLGNVLQCDNSMQLDLNLKKAKFIVKIHFLSQKF